MAVNISRMEMDTGEDEEAVMGEDDSDEPFAMEIEFDDNRVTYGGYYGYGYDRSLVGKMEHDNNYDVAADTLMDIVRIDDNNMDFADENIEGIVHNSYLKRGTAA